MVPPQGPRPVGIAGTPEKPATLVAAHTCSILLRPHVSPYVISPYLAAVNGSRRRCWGPGESYPGLLSVGLALPVRFFGIGADVLDAAVGCVCARLARTYSDVGRVRPLSIFLFRLRVPRSPVRVRVMDQKTVNPTR